MEPKNHLNFTTEGRVSLPETDWEVVYTFALSSQNNFLTRFSPKVEIESEREWKYLTDTLVAMPKNANKQVVFLTNSANSIWRGRGGD